MNEYVKLKLAKSICVQVVLEFFESLTGSIILEHFHLKFTSLQILSLLVNLADTKPPFLFSHFNLATTRMLLDFCHSLTT